MQDEGDSEMKRRTNGNRTNESSRTNKDNSNHHENSSQHESSRTNKDNSNHHENSSQHESNRTNNGDSIGNSNNRQSERSSQDSSSMDAASEADPFRTASMSNKPTPFRTASMSNKPTPFRTAFVSNKADPSRTASMWNKADPFRTASVLKKAVRLVLLLGTVLFGVGLLAAIGLYVYLLTTPLPTAYIPQTSQILDYNGEVIDVLHSGQNRQVVQLEQVSPYVINATLAIEDHRFYSHFGIDLYGLGRAVWIDIQHMSMSQGASTLTQQLARNLYLTHEKTWSRKAKEALLAMQIEMKHSKRDILTQYLNQIYYGHATYGIQAASKLFFDKDAKHLTLAESALLAGIPKGPRYYSPYMNEENAIERQHLVLQAMVNHNYITQEEADEAKNEPLSIIPLQKREPSEAPYFRDYVRRQTMALLGLDEEAFNEGGFIIHTTLDMRLQRIAEQVVEERLQETELQAALIAMDPRNGYIKAMIGGRNYPQNQYNRVFATSRQPGSAFKPILYLAALERGDFSAVTQFKSEPTIFSYDEGRGAYAPKNYGNRYTHEMIDLRKAISTSDNIYAVHTITEIGAERVIDVARRLRIASDMQPLPSLALGTFPISPYELVSAFSTIANQGVYQEPITIMYITDGRGKLLYEHKPQAEQIIDAAHTYVLTSMLESVFEPGGTGHRVAWMLKRPVAAKTGTTNTDAWMAGFTPELSTAVWVGHDRDRTLSAAEATHAAPIFAQFTEQALEHIPPKLFPVPEHVVSLYIDPESGHIATEHCPESRLEHFVSGSEPVQFCTLHHNDLELELELKGIFPLDDVPAVDHKVEPKHDSWWRQLKNWWND